MVTELGLISSRDLTFDCTPNKISLGKFSSLFQMAQFPEYIKSTLNQHPMIFKISRGYYLAETVIIALVFSV